jgi:transposase
MMMRGIENNTDALFVYVSPDSFVPSDHPLRPIRIMADKALDALSDEFDRMYSHTGRPSVPPEVLLKSLLLQVLYSVRSNRLLVEQLGYNILYRWFLGLSLEDEIWDHSTFSQNQERLIGTDIAAQFLHQIIEQAKEARLLSQDHFSVDGTLIEAWASIKSFHPKGDGPPRSPGRNDAVDFHGKTLTNDTHASTTDPDARLYRKSKGKEAKLCYMGHTLMENRNGLVVDTRVTKASGTAECDAAANMIEKIPGLRRVTIGADKNYDTEAFVGTLRSCNATPHVAQNDTNRTSAIDSRTTRHPGYTFSQKFRKRIEESFGWIKTIGTLRKTRYRGEKKVAWYFTLTAAAYNLVRMRNLGLGVT